MYELVDGDKLLVLAQKNIIKIAKRCMKNVNPLFYEMKKANSQIIDNQCKYNGLRLAFVGGNIGVISNDISKIWNNLSGIGQNEIDAVKWLCMETNFRIDFAKTLFKPTRPPIYNEIIKSFHNMKVPYFFQYAKGKTASECEETNNSTMNKIVKEIKDSRLSFTSIKRMNKIDYKMLVSDINVQRNEEIENLYRKLNSIYGLNLNTDKKNNKKTNGNIIALEVKGKMRELGYLDDNYVVDTLSLYLYKKSNTIKKKLFWFTYGDIVLKNLKNNINKETKYCNQCGKRVNKNELSGGLCYECVKKETGLDKFKTIRCIDCDNEFQVSLLNTKTCRCGSCQHEHDKKRKRDWKNNR